MKSFIEYINEAPHPNMTYHKLKSWGNTSFGNYSLVGFARKQGVDVSNLKVNNKDEIIKAVMTHMYGDKWQDQVFENQKREL